MILKVEHIISELKLFGKVSSYFEASNFYFKCLKAYSFSSHGETECQAETFAVYAGANGENTIKYFYYLAKAIVLTPCTDAKTEKEKFMCGL
jgi:hypothetical protein